MSRIRIFTAALIWAVAFCTGWANADAVDPEGAHRAVRGPRLDPDRAIVARDVALVLGSARFDLQQGVLFPSVSPDGEVLELVFLGRARFRLSPPNPIEAGQLQLFTGRRAVDASVEEAVFVLNRDATVRSFLDGTPALDLQPAMLRRAEALHRRWLQKPERRQMGVEAALFLDRVGDPRFDDYVGVWMNSYELGEFVYQHDPAEEEAVTLASFEPIGVQGWERRRLQRHLRVQQRKGRWLGTRVEDLGAWDVWMSAHGGEGAEDSSAAFEARHYKLDVKVQRDYKLAGTAELEIEAAADGRKAVRLELFRDLVVDAVTDGEGRPLYFFRSGSEIFVHLLEDVSAGERFRLRVRFGGYAFDEPLGGAIDLKDTVHWYPHCGSRDRATYDVTVSVPKRWQLVGSGTTTESGIEKGFRWERRKIDRPAIAFSFVVGRFIEEHAESDGIRLRVAFSKGSGIRQKGPATRRVIESLAEAMHFYRERLGDYPLETLEVAVLPRRYSQSFLGYMTLTDSILQSDGAQRGDTLDVLRDLTISHEAAHQWWGNLVGWSSYRDQWLSESMANYASLFYLSQRDDAGTDFLAQMSSGWRDSLSQRTPDGRVIESLGPIVLGERLNSSLASNGYRPIVYRKGAVVLAMLARVVGPDRFFQMLGELADGDTDRVLTTESFLESIERSSGMELDGFAEQFIYGTGVPQVYYDFQVVESGEGWRIVGRAKVLEAPRYGFAVEADGDTWRVLRRRVDRSGNKAMAMMVPFRVVADGSVQRGQIFLDDTDQAFSLELPSEPSRFDLDPSSEVFARFYSRAEYPKRFARYRGMDLALAGDHEKAQESFRQALGLDSELEDAAAGGSIPWLRSEEAAIRGENVRIRLNLARLHLEQGADAQVWSELAEIDALMVDAPEMHRMRRDVLAARLEMRAGQFDAAHRRLRKTLRLASPKHGALSWRALLAQLRLTAEREAMTEAYALLAVASLQIGRDDDYRWAVQEARDRGVDVSALPRLDSSDSSPIMAR